MKALIIRIACFLGLLLLLLPAALPSGGRSLAGEGKLQKIKKKVKDRDKGRDKDRGKDRGKGKKKRDKGGRDKDSKGLFDDEDDDDDDDWDLELLIGALDCALHVLALPFTVPAEMVNDGGERLFRFENYPYRRPGRAYVRVIPRKEKEKGPPAEGQPPGWEGPARKRARRDEVDLDVSFRPTYSFERHSSGLYGHRAEVLMRSNARYNLDLSFTDYAEDVSGGGSDHMQHIKGHVTYSFAVSPRVLFAAGIGGRALAWEDGTTASGIDFRYEAEFFPRKPLYVHLITEGGWIEREGVWELEARVGVAYKRLQFFLGYRHFSVAGEDLAGPTFGLTLWF